LRVRSKSVCRAGERGNMIAESALTFLPLMAMLFGLMDVSFVVFVQSTLTSATREGARFAITYSPTYNSASCASSQAACIAQVVQNNAMGFLSGTKANYITVKYYTANDLTNPADSCNAGTGTCTLNPAAVSTASLPQTLSNGKVVSFANQPGNIVEVSIAGYPWNWIVPLPTFSAGSGVTLGAASMDVMGGLAVGVTTPPAP